MGSKLIIIAVLVLGVFAIAQLMRLYELSSKMTKQGESEVNIRDNNMNGKLMFLFMGLLFIGFIWLMAKYGMPVEAEIAFAVINPVRRPPISPGPAVTAIASIAESSVFA